MDSDISDNELLEVSTDAADVAVTHLLEQGISVFYFENDQFIREDPNGERFEICFEAQPGTYKIIRKLTAHAA
jgi:hypothetical protein